MIRIRPFLIFYILFLTNLNTSTGQTSEKIRILILTDIENEPDDAESLVRFLLYSNMFDVEGLVATTSCWQRDKIADWRIHEIVDAYGKVRDNLEKHENGYPEYAYLKSVIKKGYPDFGMKAVGKGKDSEGSEWIIKVVDEEDPRPVWIPVWGGANCLAQALWKVKMTRSEDELNKFVSKIRIYTISDQDDSGPWMRNTFPDLFYICSPGYHENGGNAYFYATWTGISGERNYKFPSGANKYIIDNEWVDEHIQNHGPLGAEYPDIAYIMEGDTPSFLYLVNNGLNDPEHPNFGSWGGRYAFYTPRTRKFFHEPETRPFWTNTDDLLVGEDGTIYISEQATIWRWREAYQHDFAARMDWTIMSYSEANHPPVVKIKDEKRVKIREGLNITLNAEESYDPEGDHLTYHWFHYREPGTFVGNIHIENPNQKTITINTPEVEEPATIHIILEVSDDGMPSLTRYQRVILTVLPDY
jgi:hypothetical protein